MMYRELVDLHRTEFLNSAFYKVIPFLVTNSMMVGGVDGIFGFNCFIPFI